MVVNFGLGSLARTATRHGRAAAADHRDRAREQHCAFVGSIGLIIAGGYRGARPHRHVDICRRQPAGAQSTGRTTAAGIAHHRDRAQQQCLALVAFVLGNAWRLYRDGGRARRRRRALARQRRSIAARLCTERGSTTRASRCNGGGARHHRGIRRRPRLQVGHFCAAHRATHRTLRYLTGCPFRAPWCFYHCACGRWWYRVRMRNFSRNHPAAEHAARTPSATPPRFRGNARSDGTFGIRLPRHGEMIRSISPHLSESLLCCRCSVRFPHRHQRAARHSEVSCS
jgi:hypothetical protein